MVWFGLVAKIAALRKRNVAIFYFILSNLDKMLLDNYFAIDSGSLSPLNHASVHQYVNIGSVINSTNINKFSIPKRCDLMFFF